MPTIRCKCNEALSYKPEQGGKLVTCPHCSARLRLPIADRDASSQTAQANPDELDQLELAPLPIRERAPASQEDALTLEQPPPSATRTGNDYALATPPEPSAHRPPAMAPHTKKPPLRKFPGQTRIPSFWEALPSVFTYPVKGNGGIAIIVGIVFFAVAQLIAFVASFIPLIGAVIFLGIAIILLGLFVGYLRDIMLTSSQGEPEAPDWPDLTDYVEDALKPFLFMIALAAISMGPWIAYRYFVEDENVLLRYALLAGGLFYMPMGLLCIALLNDPAALNPVLVIRAICNVFGKYLVAWALSAACFAAYVLINLYLRVLIVGPIVQLAATFYLGLASARVLGLLYFTSKEELDWIAG